MVSKEVLKKIAEDAIAVQLADISVIKEKRGTKFTIPDAKPYVDAVKKMEALEGMKKEVIDLHVKSVEIHYEILNDICIGKTIRPEDDPFVEHYQTPAILEILYEEDPALREAVEKFVASFKTDAIRALIGKEAIRRYTGFYGPTCVVDFAVSAGSTSGLFGFILDKLDIPKKYKETILAAKSWGMNTSYGFGAAFTEAMEAGRKVEEALDAEIEWLSKIWLEPTKAQVELMKKAGHVSFDPAEYEKRYKEGIKPYVKAALDAGVHPANICVVPAYCVGDVGHHIAQSMFNMAKDDVVMAILEAVSECLALNLPKAIEEGKVANEYKVLGFAGGTTAAATTFILGLDGFTVPMVIDLLVKRFFNYVQKYPGRGQAAELHNVDFMDMLLRGEKIIAPKPKGKGGVLYGYKLDFSPILKNEVIMNPQRYTYPGCAITVRFSALMRLADFPCLLTSEPVTATINTYIAALHPETPISPPLICKDCAVCRLMTGRCKYCYYRAGVAKETPLY